MEKRVIKGSTVTFYVDAPSRSEDAEGSLPTIVLLHGFPMCGRVWAEVAERLAGQYRVIRPNLRGFGTLVCSEAFSIEDLADDVRGLLHELGAVPCVMAGLSMGGYVAQAYADRWPGDLRGLALVNTRAHADDDAAKQKRNDMARLAEARGTVAVVDAMHPKLLAPAADSAVREALLRIMLDTPAHTVVHAVRAMRDRKDYADLLSRLDLPVAVVAGDQDQVVPPDEAEAMANSLCDGRMTLLEGVGHISPLEDPRGVADAIARLARDAFASSR